LTIANAETFSYQRHFYPKLCDAPALTYSIDSARGRIAENKVDRGFETTVAPIQLCIFTFPSGVLPKASGREGDWFRSDPGDRYFSAIKVIL
jgi:hypothetical protein